MLPCQLCLDDGGDDGDRGDGGDLDDGGDGDLDDRGGDLDEGDRVEDDKKVDKENYLHCALRCGWRGGKPQSADRLSYCSLAGSTFRLLELLYFVWSRLSSSFERGVSRVDLHICHIYCVCVSLLIVIIINFELPQTCKKVKSSCSAISIKTK